MSLIYGKQLDRNLLPYIHTPEPVGAHYPICHDFFLQSLEKALTDAGFEIHANEVVVSRHFPKEKEIARVEGYLPHYEANPEMSPPRFAEGIGQRAFGGLAITREDFIGKERQLVCGWRNSHDKTFKSAVCIGSRMMVCDNLCFSAERMIGRKHTRNIERDIPAVISKIVHGLVAEWTDMETRILAYKKVGVYRDGESAPTPQLSAADLIVKLVEHKAIPPTKMAAVFDYWLNPAKAAKTMIDKTAFLNDADEYDEDAYNAAISSKGFELESAFGKGVSLWGLYNAFTQALKGSDFTKLAARTMAAQALFDTLANVEVTVNTDVEIEEETEEGIVYSAETETMEGRVEEEEEEEEEEFANW